MRRREFIKYSVALGAMSAIPAWARMPVLSERPALPVPDLLQADIKGKIRLRIQAGKTLFNGKQVTTWGYNGNLLGPALALEKGKAVTVEMHNALPQPTTVHWHGLAIPGSVDGGPQGIIAPGATRTVTFTPEQPASTCWFHPHYHKHTGQQVAMGLAGLVLIDDAAQGALRLPKQWGIDDVPLIIQDKRFTASGEIDYQLDVMTAAVGWFGDTLLCNGVEYPQHAPPRGWLRLRLLNGCNARSLTIAASDNRPLYVIASDGGLLPEPVKVTSLPLLMGERFEIMVDTRDGTPFDLVTLPVSQMGMTLPPFDKPCPVVGIRPLRIPASGDLPDTLVALPALPALEGLEQRVLTLSMDHRLDHQGMQALKDKYGQQAMGSMNMSGMNMHHASEMNNMPGMSGMHGMQGGSHMSDSPMDQGAFDLYTANRINGKAFDMNHPAFHVPLGRYERWVISGEGDMMLHPFHIHGMQFRILTENGQPPAEHRRGWKDTVRVEGGRSEVLVRFDYVASAEHAYMAHCHLLEHEDTGMMLGFTVGEA